MKIVIAPDSFKGNLTASQVASFIEEGVRRVCPEAEILKVPMADGGEGTVQSLIDATGGRIVAEEVLGPLGQRIKAEYGILGDCETAVIEMAAASGLSLVPANRRNPLLTTTYGTGELILAALNEGCRRVIVGIGGSATVDGGSGMAQALGVKLLNSQGTQIGFGGGSLPDLEKIDVSKIDPRANGVQITVASDVKNPLLGSSGAASIYGPQKGATPDMVKTLEEGLRNFSAIIRRDLGKDIKDIPGAGAAGGLGAGFMVFLDAKVVSGVDTVIEITRLAEKLKDADLVITGEGRMDSQTVYGKTPIGVARIAKKYGVPVVAIVGEASEDVGVVYEHGIDGIIAAISSPVTRAQAMSMAPELIPGGAEHLMRLIRVGIGKT